MAQYNVLKQRIATLEDSMNCFQGQPTLAVTVANVGADQLYAEAAEGDPSIYVPTVDPGCLG